MKKNVFRRIVEIASYVLIALVAILFVFVLISGVKGGVAFVGKYAVIWVKTGSMEPVIPARSYILIAKQDVSTIQVGDVIVFRSDDPELDGAYNTHRVAAIIGDRAEFVTCGDNNLIADRYTAKPDNVIGVYQKTLPTLSALGRFLTSPIGMLAACALVLGLTMAAFLPDLKRSLAKDQEEAARRKQEEIERRIREEVERLAAQNAAPDQPDQSENETPETEPVPEQNDNDSPEAPMTPEEPEKQEQPESEDSNNV